MKIWITPDECRRAISALMHQAVFFADSAMDQKMGSRGFHLLYEESRDAMRLANLLRQALLLQTETPVVIEDASVVEICDESHATESTERGLVVLPP